MIHRCKSLFSSACLCVRGQPHSLFHSIITLVSLKIFAQKKPTVWPLFSLGFQGTFPSSPESKGEAALRFSQSLPDSEAGSRQTLLDQRHAEVESLHFGCQMEEDAAVITSYHSYGRQLNVISKLTPT